MLRYATASGYVDPDGIGSFLFGDRRGLVGRFGVSSSEIATLYLGAATPALAIIGWRRGGRDGAPVRLLFWLIALSLAWATGLVGWLMDPLPLVRTVAGHEPVRGIVLGLLCVSVLAAFALPEPRRWPSPLTVGALGLLVGVLAGGTGAFALSYLIPLAGICAVLALAHGLAPHVGARPQSCGAPFARVAARARRRPRLAGEPSGSAAALAAGVADRSGAVGQRRVPARAAARRGAVPDRHGRARADARAPAGRAPHEEGARPAARPGGAAARARGRRGLQPGASQALRPPDAAPPMAAARWIATSSSRCATRRRNCARWPCATTCRPRGVAARACPSSTATASAWSPATTPRCRSRASSAPDGAPQAARVVSREPDRIVIAPPGAGAPRRRRPRVPGLEGRDRRAVGARARGRRPARRRGSAGRPAGHLDVHAARRPRGSRDLARHSPSCSASRRARACSARGPGAARGDTSPTG